MRWSPAAILYVCAELRTSTMRGYLARLVLREAEARGLSLDRVLAQVGLTQGQLSNSRVVIPVDRLSSLLRSLTRELEDPGLGLLAGTRAAAQDMGIPGLLLRSSPDTRAALALYRRHRFAWSESTGIEVVADPSGVKLRYSDATVSPTWIIAECFCSCVITLIRELVGTVTPLEVLLPYGQPLDLRPYEEILGVRPTFDACESAVVFPSSLLMMPMTYQDRLVTRVLEPVVGQIATQATQVEANFLSQVRDGILREMSTGSVSFAKVASRLAWSERSLRRQLSRENTTYIEVLEETRRQLALAYVNDGVAGAEIAQALCYANAATFYRAFRRWQGVSLSQYRGDPDRLATPQSSGLNIGDAESTCPGSSDPVRGFRYGTDQFAEEEGDGAVTAELKRRADAAFPAGSSSRPS
jgi:AraC-like DNA-binding protein